MSRNLHTAAAMGALAACLSVGASFALADELSPAAGSDSYRPIQSLTYDFGSKSTSGYFVPENGVCRVVLMVSEKADPDAATLPSPTRLRLTLTPGQAASLDSEQGRTVSVACGEGAATLLVTAGPTEALLSGTCDAAPDCSKVALKAR